MRVWVARDESGRLRAYREYPRVQEPWAGNDYKRSYFPNAMTPEHPFGLEGHVILDLDEEMFPEIKFENGPIEMEVSFTHVAKEELTDIPEDDRVALHFTNKGIKIEKY